MFDEVSQRGYVDQGADSERIGTNLTIMETSRTGVGADRSEKAKVTPTKTQRPHPPMEAPAIAIRVESVRKFSWT